MKTTTPIETPLVSADLPAAKGAYSAKFAKKASGDKKIWTVDGLMKEGLSYLEWDGMYVTAVYDLDRS